MKKELKMHGNMFYFMVGDDASHDYDNLIECQDDMEDKYTELMNEEHDYRCDFCQEWFCEADVQHRLEDSRFTAPCGSTLVLGGNVGSMPVCPICKDDLEECL